jgi:hypothetical protein
MATTERAAYHAQNVHDASSLIAEAAAKLEREGSYPGAERRVRGRDGSHNRAARQALAMRGFKQGKLAGNGQEKLMLSLMSFPSGSLDRYHNLVGTHHVQTATHSRLDHAWVRS